MTEVPIEPVRLREWSKRELRREVKRLRPLALHTESLYAQHAELQRQVEHVTRQKGLVADRNTQLRSALLRSRSSLDEARRILDAVLGPANQGGIDGTDRPATTGRRRTGRRTPGPTLGPNTAERTLPGPALPASEVVGRRGTPGRSPRRNHSRIRLRAPQRWTFTPGPRMTDPVVLDADGEEIRAGRYSDCPICGLLFRDPVQDVDPLTLATSLPSGPGEAPRFKLSELYHQLSRQQERVLQAHLDTHTMVEAIGVINRLQRERDQLREWHDGVLAALERHL